MKKNFYCLLILLVILSISHAQEKLKSDTTSNSHRIKFDPARNPQEDLKLAIAEASKSKKRILLDVGGEWCIWCRKLDKFFETNKDVNEFLINNFVVVKINFSPENKNEKFLSKYPKVAGYPHIFILEKNGELLSSQNTGDLETGDHHDKDKVLAFLKKWAPEKVADN